MKTSLDELYVRKGLVVMQFVLSTVFIIAVLVVYRQMKYAQSKNLSYNMTVSFQAIKVAITNPIDTLRTE